MSQAPQTVILLGASNLARGFPTVLSLLRTGLPGPLDVVVAMGHGRSFGIWSYLFGRRLPGIVACRLWPHLRTGQAGAPPPLALIADLGNDLMYGVPVETVLGWLELTLQRLRTLNAATVMLSLPLTSLERLTPAGFAVARRLLFPGHRASWPELRGQLAQLDAGMRELSRRFGAQWVEADGAWYGIDPIHIRRRQQAAAWQTLFSHWPVWRGSLLPACGPGLVEALSLRLLRPAERELFGVRQRMPQPARRYPDCQLFLF